MKEYLLHEKWDIIIFIFVYVTGFVSSVIFIGGPMTYSGPIGILNRVPFSPKMEVQEILQIQKILISI